MLNQRQNEGRNCSFQALNCLHLFRNGINSFLRPLKCYTDFRSTFLFNSIWKCWQNSTFDAKTGVNICPLFRKFGYGIVLDFWHFPEKFFGKKEILSLWKILSFWGILCPSERLSLWLKCIAMQNNFNSKQWHWFQRLWWRSNFRSPPCASWYEW